MKKNIGYLLSCCMALFSLACSKSTLNVKEESECKLFSYSCFSDSSKIKLPSDFHGPRYYNHEEGSVVQFYTADMCNVCILCAGNTILSLDSTYVATDSIHSGNTTYSYLYYSVSKKRYARNMRTSTRFYMYDGADEKRKKQLDKVFDEMQKTDK